MKTLLATLLLLSSTAHAAGVSLRTADDVQLRAEVDGSGKHAVVLVHGIQSDHAAWGDLHDVLVGQKRMVISVDLRGHGASKGAVEPTKMTADVLAAVDYAKKKGAEKITLIGAGMGGNLSFSAAAADPSVSDVVMISPRLDAQGVKMSAALKGFGQRPLMMITGGDDQLSIKAAGLISDRLDTSTVEILDTPGAGLKLLNRDSTIQGILVSWCNGAYDTANGKVPEANLETGSGDDLETTGVKLGEKKK